MNRREVLAGAAAVAALPVAAQARTEEIHPVKGETYKDLYWHAQTHIDKLELELSEMRAHAIIMKKNAPVD